MDTNRKFHEIGTLSGINKIVKGYKQVTIAAMIMAFLIFIISLVTAISYYSSAAKQIFIARDVRIEKVKDKKFMVQNHVELFLQRFFALDPNNWQRSTKEALYLIDEGGNELYSYYKEKKWFDKIIQYNLNINVSVDSVFVDMKEYPYFVSFSGKMVIMQQSQTIFRHLDGSCRVSETSNSESNPYGLQITAFKITNNNNYESNEKSASGVPAY